MKVYTLGSSNVDAPALYEAILPYSTQCVQYPLLLSGLIMKPNQVKSIPLDTDSIILRSEISPTIKELDWGKYEKLVRIRICLKAMSRTNRFLVHDLPQLSSVIVERGAFATSNEVDKECRIYECPKLTTLSFQRGSFKLFSLLELRNLPLLTSFELVSSFTKGKTLHLQGK